ncbi:MAG: hypothetical protein HFG94_05740 [Dorea sp.]|nr:hypothetical protein [Dorea sp.]MCI9614600.1 hypothetical protein [Dorea sp.]MDE6936737.1 hypothetical protein [Lachnospiraceae bacterium]
MENNRMEPHSLDIRKTKFTALKDRQCSLNMRIRLAMQIHDMKAQEDLEKELKEVMEEINHMVW